MYVVRRSKHRSYVYTGTVSGFITLKYISDQSWVLQSMKGYIKVETYEAPPSTTRFEPVM